MRRTAALLLVPAFSGCGAVPDRQSFAPESVLIDPHAIQTLMTKAPLQADQNLRAETLTASDQFSAHLLQFRTGERRHVHRRHDLTFIVHRGQGELFLNDRRHVLHPGDVFHIPRGTPHHCLNTGRQPLVVVNIFTPPFDLKDSVPVSSEQRSYERDGEPPP